MAIRDGRRQQNVDLKYPYEGLSETFAFSDQPVGTTRDERNMRSFDPTTGRMRGTQRSGIELMTGDAPANGFSKISSLVSVQREVNPYSWSVLATAQNEATIGFDREHQTTGFANCVDLRRDTFDTYWALSDGGEVVKLNSDGGVIKRIPVSVDDNNELYARKLAVDDYGNCFVSSGQLPGHETIDNERAWIKAYELQADGEYKLAWTIKPGFHVLDMQTYGQDLYVFGIHYHQQHANSIWEFRRYAEYVFDEEPVAEANSTWSLSYNDATDLGNHYQYPTGGVPYFVGCMAVRPDGDAYVCASVVDSTSGSMHARYWIMARLSPISTDAANQQWIKEAEYTSANAADHGWGLSVQVTEDTASDGSYVLLCCGGVSNSVGQHHVSVWSEIGNVATKKAGLSFDNGAICKGWSLAAPGAERIRTAIDENGNFYVPYHGNDANSLHNGKSLLIFDWQEWSMALTRSEAQADLGLVQTLLTVAVPVAVPDYNGGSQDYVDRVVTGGTPQTTVDPNDSVNIALLATAKVSASLPVREIRNVATCGGNWYEYSSSGYTLLDDGSAAISYNADAPYISSATASGIAVFSDGSRYYYYNPKDRVITKMRSQSNGYIPPRCRLVSFWRGRLVLARSDEAPGAWHMSRVGKPFDWDEFPPIPDAGAAVSNVTSKAGLCPDSINTIVPYKDDVLWFGCDRSIYQMSGDPGAGGSFDLVSDEIGMSFGRPWCKDDAGRLWFFGSKGGLYTMAPGTGLQDVSLGRVRKRMQNIDLETHYVELVYNFIDDGVHVFVMPFANPGIIVDHYFYSKRTNSFHVDRFGRNTGDGIQPTAALIVDGDSPADRAMHIGCEDGRIRKWGQTESSEVPKGDRVLSNKYLPIDSYVLMGPIAPNRDMDVHAIGALTVVLAPNYSGCNYEFYETDNAAQLGDPLESGQLQAGRNGTHMVRVSGDSIYLMLRNAREQETWSYEKGQVHVSYAGGIRA